MHTLLTILIGLAIAGWFLYCLYRMLRGARGRDCTSCHLAGGFDYKSSAPVKPATMKRKEIVTDTGHLIIVDEEAAKRRRERIRKMMEQPKDEKRS